MKTAKISRSILRAKLTQTDETFHANEEAVSRVLNAKPELVGIGPAIKAIPRMRRDTFLHAGPSLSWGRMTGAMRGAAVGAMLYEGFADTPKEALSKLEANTITFQSAHDHDSVSPMGGIISCTMPVFKVRNASKGNYSFCPINEGVGKVRTLRYGAYAPDVLKRLRWIRDVLGPALSEATRMMGRIDLKQIISEALRRGDECHNRNKSATSIFFKIIAPSIVRVSSSRAIAAQVLDFMGANDHFFLNLSMAASKASLDSAHGIRNSSIVTGMSSNGRAFGIRVSGLRASRPPNEWCTAPSPFARGKYFGGYTKLDANPVLGDSYVSECVGLGAFAMAASPAITEFIGGSPRWAEMQVKRMRRITWAKNSEYVIPYMNYLGTPTGIDFRKVIRTGVLPILNTGIAHKRPGVGQIGAGIFYAPVKCFQEASIAWAAEYGTSIT
jgi:hypothetical protein